jgi:RNA polymerase sporulation-specific sigma factor
MSDMDKLTEEQIALVENNINFVHHIAKRFKESNAQKDDIISAGYFGLVKAARTFKVEKGTKFTTYAGICINNSILDLLDDNRKKQRKYASLDDPIINDAKGNHMTIADLYDDGERIEDEVFQRSEIEERKLIVGLYLINKSPRFAQIIKLRLQDKTHDAIAREIGISKSYISRILTKIEKELMTLKNRIDKTNGEYIKKYSPSDIAKAKAVLRDNAPEWMIQIEQNSLDPKNKSVHAFLPSVNFLQKRLSFNSDLMEMLDPDSRQMDIMFTKMSDINGVLVFRFRHSGASYFLQMEPNAGACIESVQLTDWLLENGIIPKRYTTCYYDDAERTLYIKVECTPNGKKQTGD